MMTDRNQRGFTLVETLVAIAILMISIVGPLYSVYQAVQSTYIARDQLIATSLAQEGIEYVRHNRDSTYLYNLAHPSGTVNWMNGLSACQVAGKSCTIDAADGTNPPVTCAAACTPLNLSATGLYVQSAGTPTRFTRSVKINTVNQNEVVVLVTVSWVNSHIPFSITVTEHLYNWL